MDEWLEGFDPNTSKGQKLLKYLETILLWSGYRQYMEVKEIAKHLKIEPSTVSRRIQWFKKNYPDGYKRVKADRDAIKNASNRLDEQLEKMSNGKFISYDDLDPDTRDEIVKERF